MVGLGGVGKVWDVGVEEEWGMEEWGMEEWDMEEWGMEEWGMEETEKETFCEWM